MRILVVSYLFYDDNKYAGGGWVDSIASCLSEYAGNEVSVLYVSKNRTAPWNAGKIRYFPVLHKKSIIRRIIGRITHNPGIIIEQKQVDRIVEEFKPEIIQLFGLETPISSLVNHIRQIPIVVHLQGVCKPCVEAWFPAGYDRRRVDKYSSLKDKCLMIAPTDLYKRFCRLAENERVNFKIYKYYLGRTDFDREYCSSFSSGSSYFHCDEILRKEFYCASWHSTSGRIRIASLANGEIYKGYDTILKTASLLKSRGLDFEWNLYGVDESFSLKRIFEKIENKSFNKCNVFFRGRKSASELAAILSESSLFVHASHIDNSPNALCEAMMIGVPSIAVNVGGVSSLIDDGVDGFLVKDYDVEGLCNKIIEVTSSEETMEIISNASRIRAAERHDRNTIVTNLMGIYGKILGIDIK